MTPGVSRAYPWGVASWMQLYTGIWHEGIQTYVLALQRRFIMKRNKKKQRTKVRNWSAVNAQFRKAGAFRNKKGYKRKEKYPCPLE